MDYSQQQHPDQYQDGQPIRDQHRDQHHARFPSDHSDETIVSFVEYNTAYQHPAMPTYYYGQSDGQNGMDQTGETVVVREVQSSPQTPPPQPPKTKSNKWSITSSKATSVPSEKGQGKTGSGITSSVPKLAKVKTIKWTKTGTWTFEIVSLVFAIAAVASIIAILESYDNKPLPSWPYKITLNALIAVLTTFADAAMAVPLSSGLGQLKWERFKTGYAPLTDMEVLDEASRGALGALHLLRKQRGG